MLLIGIGISNIGEWVYLLSLNITILNSTDSTLAVSILYIMVPLATLATNFWVGSYIDRLNKKRLLIVLDFIRAGLIILLAFMPGLIYMYLIVFFINMASSIFSTTSIIYMTKLIPGNERKQFNTYHSLVTSGAFLVGPAIAGVLFILLDSNTTIYLNAIALCLSGIIMLFMPNIEENTIDTSQNKLSLQLIREDWLVVSQFSKKYHYIIVVYFLFQGVTLVMASAIDSLEVSYAKEVLGLEESSYGFLVSIAGVGIIIGSILNVIFARRMSVVLLIGVGTACVSIGYVLYSLSSTFLQAALGFFFLAFFTAPANTGFLTFYQNSIPIHMMGRISSIYQLISLLCIIILTVILGITAEIISIRIAVTIGAITMLCLSFILILILYKKKKSTVSLLDKDKLGL